MKTKLFILFWVLISSCTTKDNCENNPSGLSYEQHIRPMVEQNCLGSGCHQGGVPAGGLNLSDTSSYSQLLSQGSGYVKPGNSGGSLLYIQLISKDNPMPPSGNLGSCELELVKTWIDQGGVK